ncbi:MAG: hypothetical protein IAE94_09930 [Chthoniobacterales bacterium]|nr:hypothetical protein [Chthoniobacterales bacterium]
MFLTEKLKSDHLAVEIVPEIGARISSLKTPGGREWMWAPTPERRLHRGQPGDNFLSSCLIGADECLPTIVGCEWQGRVYPGHGECWNASWQTTPRRSTQEPVETRLDLPLSGVHFRRKASLTDNALLLEYEVINRGKARWDFAYAFHPLFTLLDGDQVDLPIAEAGRIFVENWDGREARWPSPVPEADLSRFAMGTIRPNSLKVFTADPLLAHRAEVWNAGTREKLVMEFDPAFFPALGFYANVGGWGGHRHFAIEPTNAQADSLEQCVRRSLHYSTLPPGEGRTWWIRITVETVVQAGEVKI